MSVAWENGETTVSIYERENSYWTTQYILQFEVVRTINAYDRVVSKAKRVPRTIPTDVRSFDEVSAFRTNHAQ